MNEYTGPEWSQSAQDRLPVLPEGNNLLDSYIELWDMARAAREPLRDAEDTLEAMRDIVCDQLTGSDPIIWEGRKLSVSPTSKVTVADWLKERVILTEENVPWTTTSASAEFFVMMPFGGWGEREHFIPDPETISPENYIEAWIEVNQDEHYSLAEEARKEVSPDVKEFVLDKGSFSYREKMFLVHQNTYVNPTLQAKEDVLSGIKRYMGLSLIEGHTLRCTKAPKS